MFRYQGAPVYVVPEPNRSPEQRLADMDAAGVDVQVLSLGTPNVYVADLDESRALAVLTNDLLAGLSRAHPTRFRALASLPLGRMDDALAELERAIGGLGMDGVQLGTNYRGEYLDLPRFQPLLEELDRRGLTVFLHPVPRREVGPGRDYGLCMILDYPADTSTCVARLIFGGVLDRYPRIRWLLAHCGGALPFVQGRMDVVSRGFAESRGTPALPSAYLRRLYYDTVTSGHWPAVRCALDTVGASQVLFGTDCPHNPPDALLDALLRAPELDEAQRAAVLGGNALRLFPRLAEALRAVEPEAEARPGGS